MKKRFLAAVLSAAMLGATAFAADPVAPEDTTPAEPGNYPYTIGEEATVLEMQQGSGEYADMLVKTDTYEELVLHFSENTLLMDTQTGFLANESDLNKGDKVYVYYGAAMTRSLPPQVTAEAVLVNLDDKHFPAHLLTAEEVVRNQDGSVTILAESGSVYVTIPAETDIRPLATKNIVSLEDIHMGTQLFAWYDFVALSMPGQATATKVVLPPQQDRAFTMIHEGDIAIGEGKVENGIAMVPLRAAAEAKGFTVTWNGKEQSVQLSNGEIQTTVTLGEDLYYYTSAKAVGMSKPSPLGAASYEQDGTTWAPAQLITLLCGENSAVLMGSVMYL